MTASVLLEACCPHLTDVREVKATTDTLVSVTKPPKDQKFRKREIGIYCNGKPWSGDCTKFPTVTARKESIKRHCFISVKPDHHQRDYKTNKLCVHCQRQKLRHRSLGINEFPEKPK